MNNYFQLTENQQRLVLQQSAARYGLPPQAIENDLDDLFVEWKSKMKEQDSTSHFTRDGLM